MVTWLFKIWQLKFEQSKFWQLKFGQFKHGNSNSDKWNSDNSNNYTTLNNKLKKKTIPSYQTIYREDANKDYNLSLEILCRTKTKPEKNKTCNLGNRKN